MTRRRDDPPDSAPRAPARPAGAPPWVTGEPVADAGARGEDPARYRSAGAYGEAAAPRPRSHEATRRARSSGSGRPRRASSSATHKKVFEPPTAIANDDSGEVDRVVVDLYTPGSGEPSSGPAPAGVYPPAAGASVSGAGVASASGSYRPPTPTPSSGFAEAPDPIPVEDPDLAVPAAEDEPTQRLFQWLARRGVAPAYFSSYTRARAIIWGGDPVHAVDEGDVDRAVRRRATTATPQQLDNLRVLGKLLLQFYNSADPTGSSPSLTAVGPADSGMLPSASGSGRGAAETVEVSKPVASARRGVAAPARDAAAPTPSRSRAPGPIREPARDATLGYGSAESRSREDATVGYADYGTGRDERLSGPPVDLSSGVAGVPLQDRVTPRESEVATLQPEGHVPPQPSRPIAIEAPARNDRVSRTPLSRRTQRPVTSETRREPDPEPPPEPTRVKRHPTMEVELEVELAQDRERTPVPQLLEESKADMALDTSAKARRGRAEGSTGATPLVSMDEDPADSLAAQPGWTFPAGMVSAWDPNNRDQRPSEILRPPTSPWTTALAIVLMLVAALAVTYAIMTS